MDPNRWWLIIGYIVLLIGSAFCSASENALVAANRIRLRTWADDGNKGAKTALKLIDDFDRVLTAILIGNNICNVASASLATLFAFGLSAPLLQEGKLAEGTLTLLVSLITTVIVFFLAEMTPKSIAIAHADTLSVKLAPLIRTLATVLTPLTFFFGGIGTLVSKLFGKKESPAVTEEELSTFIDAVEKEGSIDEEQSELLQSALEFSDTTVSDILTMREDMVTIELHAPDRVVMDIISKNRYSRFPVYEGDLDHIVGILHAKRYLKARINRENLSLASLLVPPTYTALGAVIDDLLDHMSQNKTSIAIVRDEDNHTIGLVTIEDFLEELVGEIYDEDDIVNRHFTKLGGKYFRVAGDYTVGEMFRDMKYRGNVGMSRMKTVGAWVIESLGHAPEEDDTFTWRDLTITVTDVEEGKLSYIEVKLADPVLDNVVPEDEDEKEEGDQ